jgi:hypothetical protein
MLDFSKQARSRQSHQKGSQEEFAGREGEEAKLSENKLP